MQVAELVAGSGGTVDPNKPYAEFWYACQRVHALRLSARPTQLWLLY